MGQNENENLNKLPRDGDFKAPLREQNCLSTDNNTISSCEETGNKIEFFFFNFIFFITYLCTYKYKIYRSNQKMSK